MISQLVYTAEANNPTYLDTWLESTNSLTEKLQTIIGQVEVQLTNQLWTSTNWLDRYFLDIEDNSVFLREILMKGQEHKYWYARTIIPKSCYDIDPVFFGRLEKESIRNLIFGESRVTRVFKSCYSINENNLEYCWIKKYLGPQFSTRWLRLTQFQLDEKKPFYLFEIFLPDLERLR